MPIKRVRCPDLVRIRKIVKDKVSNWGLLEKVKNSKYSYVDFFLATSFLT